MPNIPPAVIDRNTLFTELAQRIETHQSDNKKLAVLLININNFRQLNIVHGHQQGDLLLDAFCQRIKLLIREHDFIARMGNAEFALVLPEALNAGHAALAANKILSNMKEAFVTRNGNYKLTANIGIAVFPDHADNPQDLMTKAEVALLESRKYLQCYAMYSTTSKQSYIDTWDIEVELRQARDQDEFELFFQPQICMKTDRIIGAEALIRWNNKNKGLIRPDIFIPVAEKNEQIHDITWWTINTALRLIKEWPEMEIPLTVAVNISAKVLKDNDLVDYIASALNIWGTDLDRLIIEVTESALMEDIATSFTTLEELRELGLNISIDDFGTGYSSMSYFKSIPATELKIDQSFISYMLDTTMDQHIVKTIITMAHGFNLKVVAEGIENKATLDALKTLGCDVAQGFYLARPMPQKDFIQWVNTYNNHNK